LTTLQKLNADLGLTVVLSEHRLERVAQYADRMLYFPGVAAVEAGRSADQKSKRSADLHGSPASSRPIWGTPREVLERIELAPPLVALGKALGWRPLPLTIKEGRRFARAERRVAPPAPAEPRAQSPDLPLAGTGGADEASPRPARHPNSHADARDPTSNSTNRRSVVLSHVHFAYGDHEALYDLSLVVRAGEVLALMGRNGSGKTTLLKLIVGLLKPQRGSVTVLGHDVTRMDVEDVAAFVGYVPQDPRALLFHDTLWQELAFTLDHRPASDARHQTGDESEGTRGDRQEIGDGSFQRRSSIVDRRSFAIEATLDQLGLAHLAQAYPRDLSGGEAQRAALAAILVGNPQVLLLDEPTRGLDYRAKAALGQLLRTLAAEQRTILLATHDVELVAAYADRVALLGDGELVVEGPVREVLSDSLIFSSQVAKLFPGTGWLTVEDVEQ
jgi:energy-coupling factor transport system ATP-binding protein